MIRLLSLWAVILAAAINLQGCDSRPDSLLVSEAAPKNSTEFVGSQSISIASFNIQFLGHFKKRDNEALATLMKDFDIVVVQELVAPPTDGMYPNGEAYTADTESASFFQAMRSNGFEYKLSEEDTGTNDIIHKKTSTTEWWVAFYKPEALDVATDLPNGYLAADRSNNDDYERVPYAFSFRLGDGKTDFVLISVHLKQGSSASDKSRRKHELASISSWINANKGKGHYYTWRYEY